MAALKNLTEARAEILSRLRSLCAIERVALESAQGRTLAESISTTMAMPPFANSAMDGYALRHGDLETCSQFTLVGTALAGHPFVDEIPFGGCVRIMTGAPLPKGGDTVVMQEEVERAGEHIRLLRSPSLGEHIRQAGEEFSVGTPLLSAGCRLGVRQIALLAAVGTTEISVYRPLKVAILSSGDELQALGATLGAGEIYDSNRPLLLALLHELGAEILDLGIIPDDPQQLRAAFTQAAKECQVLITSGGVSVGDADHIKDVLSELGEILFWKLALKPGKPFAFGKIDECWFFGLPGNPVSALVTFEQLVHPALLTLMGANYQPTPQLLARAMTPFKKSPGRLEYQRGYLTQGESGLEVATTGGQGSALLSSLLDGNCYVCLELERGNVAKGEWVKVEPFSALLR